MPNTVVFLETFFLVFLMIMNKEIFAILSSLLKQVFILEKTGLKSYVYVRLVENNLNIPFGFQCK